MLEGRRRTDARCSPGPKADKYPSPPQGNCALTQSRFRFAHRIIGVKQRRDSCQMQHVVHSMIQSRQRQFPSRLVAGNKGANQRPHRHRVHHRHLAQIQNQSRRIRGRHRLHEDPRCSGCERALQRKNLQPSTAARLRNYTKRFRPHGAHSIPHSQREATNPHAVTLIPYARGHPVQPSINSWKRANFRLYCPRKSLAPSSGTALGKKEGA
jgi:hypothetical protein